MYLFLYCQCNTTGIDIVVFYDLINLTQVHNFTVYAQDIFTLSTSAIYHKFNRNSATTNADNETFCTVQLASQVVMVQSLQPKGCEFESTCVLVFCCCFFTFIRFV